MDARKYQSPRTRITAAILSFFFGGFGAQKFYLRQYGVAIFMIIALIATRMFVFPFFAIFGVIDAIRILSMSDKDFDRKYNRYASQNRKDDYLQNRRERQIERSTRRVSNSANSRRMLQKANPFKNSGLAKYKDFDLDGAIEDFNQAIDINPNDSSLHFNIACVYSLTEQKDRAYRHLARAVELGYKDFDEINTKDDLAYVRIQPEFHQFKLNGYKLNGNIIPPRSKASLDEDGEPIVTDDVLLSQLNKLAELRKKGLLSEEEFKLERKKLLRR